MAQQFKIKLKTRKQMEKDIPRHLWGWWIDVCPGRQLTVRKATSADLDRCILNVSASRNPDDYYCEAFEGGWLISKIAVEWWQQER